MRRESAGVPATVYHQPLHGAAVRMRRAAIIALLLAGCGPKPGQWVTYCHGSSMYGPETRAYINNERPERTDRGLLVLRDPSRGVTLRPEGDCTEPKQWPFE